MIECICEVCGSKKKFKDMFDMMDNEWTAIGNCKGDYYFYCTEHRDGYFKKTKGVLNRSENFKQNKKPGLRGSYE